MKTLLITTLAAALHGLRDCTTRDAATRGAQDVVKPVRVQQFGPRELDPERARRMETEGIDHEKKGDKKTRSRSRSEPRRSRTRAAALSCSSGGAGTAGHRLEPDGVRLEPDMREQAKKYRPWDRLGNWHRKGLGNRRHTTAPAKV